MTAESRQQQVDMLIKEGNTSDVFPDGAKQIGRVLRKELQRDAWVSM